MPKKKILFAKYYDDWVETYKEGAIADVTLKKYYKTGEVLWELAPTLAVDRLDRKAYQKIINEYAKTHEKQTTVDFHHQVKSCIRDMFYDGVLKKDPTYKVVLKGRPPNRKKKPKFLQVDELRNLVRALDLSHINYDWLVMIAAKTGLRYAELLALTPNDFDWQEGTLTVDKTWNYKSTAGGFKPTKTKGSVRTIAIDWQIIGQFKPLVEQLKLGEPIFVEKLENGQYKRQFNSTINNQLQSKCKEAGIPEISLHSLRHTHASVLLAEGVSIQMISSRLGHADVGVTQETYAHVLDELKQKDTQKMMGILMQIA